MTRKPVSHYANQNIETIDYIFDCLGYEGGRAFVLGNIIKYASRARDKGQFRSDIEKIRDYAEILLEKTPKIELHVDEPPKTKTWDELKHLRAPGSTKGIRYDPESGETTAYEAGR